MSIIAGLQDSRQPFGTPRDMGAFLQPCTVNIILDVGIYFAVDWSGGVLVNSGAVLSTVITNTLTYIAGLGGGIIFLSLMGTHTITVTVAVNVADVQFMGLGKVTVLQVNDAAPVPLFEVNSVGVSFYNLTFDGTQTAPSVGGIDGITWLTNCRRGLVSGCYFVNFSDANDHAIEVKFGSNAKDIIVANCHFLDCSSYTVAFASAGGHCSAVGNTVINSAGFEADNGVGNIFSSNILQGSAGDVGMLVFNDEQNFAIGNTVNVGQIRINSDHCSIVGNYHIATTTYNNGNHNTICGCTFYGGTYYHIEVDEGDNAIIVGNNFEIADYGGVLVRDSNDVLINGNSIIGPGVTSCVRVSGTTYRLFIIGNRLNAPYGVRIGSSDVSVIIKDNNFNGCTNLVYTVGYTPTLILDCYIVPFVHGDDPQDSGFLINANTEMARTWLDAPAEIQQVLFMIVKARAGGASATTMAAEFVIYGAADNEGYQTHNGSVANHPSTSSNFVADDVIFWTITTAGVLALLGGDSVEVKVLHEAANAGGVETNAYFRTVAIGYV